VLARPNEKPRIHEGCVGAGSEPAAIMGRMLRHYSSGHPDLASVRDLQKDPLVSWQHRHYLRNVSVAFGKASQEKYLSLAAGPYWHHCAQSAGCSIQHMGRFLQKLETLRWDDHRYYHQSRINQSLHFISAISFLVAYGLVFVDPASAGLLGWLVAMVTRQSGHIFFEPRDYDEVNHATDEYKESVKVGYNMQRKAIIIGLWLALPAVLWATPTFFGLLSSEPGFAGFVHSTGLLWLWLGVAGVLARMLYLLIRRGSLCAVAWVAKILTDPFHDISIYWRSPLALLRGERLDPIHRAATD
jgi:hypothetical protein